MNARKAASPVGDGAHHKDEGNSSHSVPESCESASQGKRYSFRWGVEMDKRFVLVPECFLDTFADAGLTGMDFLLIILLARYQWELEGSESRPAVSTLARQLGMTRRGVQKILSGLEARGFLKRHYRAGKASVYDFSSLGRTLMRIHREREVSG